MKRISMIRMAASCVALAVATVGCAAGSGIASASAGMTARHAAADAHRAEKALAKGKLDKALAFAERAVSVDPDNAAHRAVLARVYMAEGRFASAERTWQDVIDLGQGDVRAVLGVVVAQIAQGRVDSARAMLEANREQIPASDFGLALAMSGDTRRGVDVLVDAIRRDDATARTRQNLALAYALDGRWREARIMAAQDMAADAVDARIAEWAQIARPGAYQLRVASLLKVTPREDAGQPAMLALNAGAAPAALASADAAPAPSPAAGPLPAIGPAPVEDGTATFAAADPAPLPSPAMQPVADATLPPPPPIRQQIAFVPGTGGISMPAPVSAPHASPRPARAAAVAAPQAARIAAAASAPVIAPVANGAHVVQLGAFDSAAVAKDAWGRMVRKTPELKAFRPTMTAVTVNGRNFVRLAAAGLAARSDAQLLCVTVKATGGACFVRSNISAAPVRQAARKPNPAARPTRLALR